MRDQLCNELLSYKDKMVENCCDMVKIDSQTPPSDTGNVAKCAVRILNEIPGMEVKTYTSEAPVTNVVGVLKSGKPGKRLVFNGHIDTYPIGNVDAWDDDPLSGKVEDGYIWGRGSGDMKGGISCAINAARVLANHKDLWNGEIVIALAGDEEAMGMRGTGALLDSVPEAVGDAMICPDCGAPNSLRFGQKGMVWIKLVSKGKPAHGAHLHKGINAITKLMRAMLDIEKELAQIPVNPPEFVKKAILEGSAVSETTAGPGETEVLQKTTINFGTITGGTSPNLVADYAQSEADIRIPAGVTTTQVKEVIESVLSRYNDINYEVMRCYEPNWSDLDSPIFGIVKKNSEEVLKEPVVVTFRVGASDARLYRLLKNVPSINCGLTTIGLGGPNEHASIDEMLKISQIHLLSALDFLS